MNVGHVGFLPPAWLPEEGLGRDDGQSPADAQSAGAGAEVPLVRQVQGRPERLPAVPHRAPYRLRLDGGLDWLREGERPNHQTTDRG